MTPKEIAEMMLLKEWSRQELADKLGVSQNLVARWFCATDNGHRNPSQENEAKMRQWLREARAEARKQPA